ncbi:MAG: 8-oxo-dGTP diphosphatase [Caldilineaceae bacterium]
MLLRNKKANDMHAGKWNGLGGKFEPGETPEDCAIREIQEESGLTVRNPALRGILTFPGFDGEEDWYAFVFVANTFEGELIESDEGELHWIDDDRLLDLNLSGKATATSSRGWTSPASFPAASTTSTAR